MAELFSELRYVKIFLDDILVYSNSYKEHRKHLETMLAILTKNGAKISLEKSKFFSEQVDYLGLRIDNTGIRPIIRGSIQLEKLRSPKTQKELQKCLGIINWFRPFLANSSSKIAPLTDLLQKGKIFIWTKLHEHILCEIKEMILQQPILVYPNFQEVFEMQVDASQEGIGGVVFQEAGIVGYFSRELTKAGKNYPTIEKEALAVIATIQHFRTILYGMKIKIQTDHSNLTFLKNSISQRIARWRILLNEYEYCIDYMPGKLNSCADWLSRLPAQKNEFSEANNKKERNNNIISELSVKSLITETAIEDTTEDKERLNKNKYLKLEDEKLKSITKNMHTNLNHLCASRFFATMNEIYELQNQKKIIEDVCNHCVNCQLCKKGR